METSSFTRTLDMILDESKQYYGLIAETYYINEVSLIEKIRKINFKKILSFIFDRFIGIIKAIWDQFRAMYHEFMQKSALIKKYRKKLETIDWDVEIETERSMYTNLGDSRDASMYKMTINNQYSILTQSLEEIAQCKNIGSIHTIILNMKNDMGELESYLNQERGISIGSRSDITKEEYAQAVSIHFCPNKISNGVLHPSEVQNMVKEYFDFKTVEKAITKDKDSLDSAAKDLKNKISRINLEKYCPEQNINPEISELFLEMIREYCNRIQGVCNIYTQLFSIKLDMFKQYKVQQTKVLTEVIIKSIREGKM